MSCIHHLLPVREKYNQVSAVLTSALWWSEGIKRGAKSGFTVNMQTLAKQHSLI